MKYLARRDYSRAELRSKLLPRTDCDAGRPEDLDALLDDLTARGWLSDARAAAQLLQARRSRFGMQRIAQELRQRGIAEELIGAAMPALKESETEAAREVWKKKYGLLPRDDREKAKQVRFLQSRGFGLEVIFQVLRGVSDAE